MTTRVRPSFLSVFSLLGAVILMTGCATGAAEPADPGAPASAPSAAAEEAPGASDGAASAIGVAAVVLADRAFTFRAQTCMVTDEDILISGPGADDASGELAHLDVDFSTYADEMSGEIRVDVGVDSPFSSSDEFYAAMVASADGPELVVTGANVVVNAEFRVGGETSTGLGTLTVRCA